MAARDQERAVTAAPFRGTDGEVLEELGRRLARRRLDRNQTQRSLAREAGVSLSTVKRLEAGASTQLTNLVRVLRALDLVQNLDSLAPPPEVRPLERLERGEVPRRRASGQGEEPAPGWRWGDEDPRAREEGP